MRLRPFLLPQVGGWVALMPNLRRLCLYPSREAYHQKLIVTMALATLPHLEVQGGRRLLVAVPACLWDSMQRTRFLFHYVFTFPLGILDHLPQTFCFAAEELKMQDGCLPASLRTLCLTWEHYKPLPTAVTHATQLHSLALREWRGNLRAIERLSQLTYLGLNLSRGSYDVPPPPLRLAAFPQLRCLVLGAYLSNPLLLEGASSALQQLTYLSLRDVTPGSQPDLCVNLSVLTNLQVCHLFLHFVLTQRSIQPC